MNSPPSPSPSTPTILFIEGVGDDGLVKVQLPAKNKAATTNTSENLQFYATGSLQHSVHISLPSVVKQTMLMVGGNEQQFNVRMPSVIVNCIVDPDSSTQALNKAQKLIAHIHQLAKKPIAVINPVVAIRNTCRDVIYHSFHGMPSVIVPRTIRITAESVADVVKQVKKAGISLPFLIRQAGKHGGLGLQAIEDFSPAEKLKLERYAYDGSHFYITEWVDFKNADGLYRKSRIICVNGQFIPRHRIINDNWMIHSKSRKNLMIDRADLRAEEEAFLAKPLSESISKSAINSLNKIAKETRLGYFGIDCAITDNGSLLIFEINAAFNAMVQDDLALYPYLARPVNAIKKAFNDMVAERMGAKLIA